MEDAHDGLYIGECGYPKRPNILFAATISDDARRGSLFLTSVVLFTVNNTLSAQMPDVTLLNLTTVSSNVIL